MRKALSNSIALARRESGSNDPTLPTILEFQWPSTAIVNAPVPLLARGIVWIIASMVVTLIVVSGIIPVDRVVTAKGIVVSQSPTILVQPLDTAIVRSIDVQEGQRVSAGQVLAHLDPTFATADVDTTRGTTIERRGGDFTLAGGSQLASRSTMSDRIKTVCCRRRSTGIGRLSSTRRLIISRVSVMSSTPRSRGPNPMPPAMPSG